MLTPWLDAPGAADRVAVWSDRTGLDLLRLGTEGSAEEITDTAITQPLIVAVSLLSAEAARQQGALPTDSPVAGHSVGELAAAAVAGVFSDDDAVALAAVRGSEMAKACDLADSSMAAVMMGDEDDVVAWLADNGLDAANRNGAGQIVASGAADAIAKIVDNPLGGTKVRELRVAGAFHTSYMAPAQDALAGYAAGIAVQDPVRPLLSNADGAVVESGAEYLSRLVEQVTRPVRWDLTMGTIACLGCTGSVELAPAGTLSGLIRRQLKPFTAIALKSPADLTKLTTEKS